MGKQVVAGLKWGLSSVGRAPALQAGGREFESLSLHESNESGHFRVGWRLCLHRDDNTGMKC